MVRVIMKEDGCLDLSMSVSEKKIDAISIFKLP